MPLITLSVSCRTRSNVHASACRTPPLLLDEPVASAASLSFRSGAHRGRGSASQWHSYRPRVSAPVSGAPHTHRTSHFFSVSDPPSVTSPTSRKGAMVHMEAMPGATQGSVSAATPVRWTGVGASQTTQCSREYLRQSNAVIHTTAPPSYVSFLQELQATEAAGTPQRTAGIPFVKEQAPMPKVPLGAGGTCLLPTASTLSACMSVCTVERHAVSWSSCARHSLSSDGLSVSQPENCPPPVSVPVAERRATRDLSYRIAAVGAEITWGTPSSLLSTPECVSQVRTRDAGTPWQADGGSDPMRSAVTPTSDFLCTGDTDISLVLPETVVLGDDDCSGGSYIRGYPCEMRNQSCTFFDGIPSTACTPPSTEALPTREKCYAQGDGAPLSLHWNSSTKTGRPYQGSRGRLSPPQSNRRCGRGAASPVLTATTGRRTRRRGRMTGPHWTSSIHHEPPMNDCACPANGGLQPSEKASAATMHTPAAQRQRIPDVSYVPYPVCSKPFVRCDTDRYLPPPVRGGCMKRWPPVRRARLTYPSLSTEGETIDGPDALDVVKALGVYPASTQTAERQRCEGKDILTGAPRSLALSEAQLDQWISLLLHYRDRENMPSRVVLEAAALQTSSTSTSVSSGTSTRLSMDTAEETGGSALGCFVRNRLLEAANERRERFWRAWEARGRRPLLTDR